MTRHQDINDALEAANEFSAGIGLATLAGIYTGMWFVIAYLFGWLPPGVVRWLADYSQPAGELLNGDLVVGHQYSSTPIDQSVFEDSEIVSSGGDVTDPEREQMQATIDGLVSSLGYVAGDLLAPVARQKSNTKAVGNLVAGIRQQADQHGINHA